MDLEVVLVPNGEWKKFEDFLKSLNVKYRIREEKLQIRPALILRKNNCEIVYHAIPAGNELEPFLKTLEILSESKCEGINGEIMVFITPTCPVCANVVEIVNRVAISKGLRSIIVDATMFPDLAQKFEITAVPTVIIDGKMKLVGYISEEDLINVISKSYKDYIIKLLKERRIEDVKDLAKSIEVAKILAELLAFPDFMVRLGAMIILEQLDPNLIKYVKEDIRKLLKHKDDRIREDVAMLLGDIGDEEDISYLEELMNNDENRNVVEAAMEAVEKIKMRLKS